MARWIGSRRNPDPHDRNSSRAADESDDSIAARVRVVNVPIWRQRMGGKTLAHDSNRLVGIGSGGDPELKTIAVKGRDGPTAEETHHRERRTDRLVSVANYPLVVTIRSSPPDVAGDLLQLRCPFAS